MQLLKVYGRSWVNQYLRDVQIHGTTIRFTCYEQVNKNKTILYGMNMFTELFESTHCSPCNANTRNYYKVIDPQ